MIFTVLGNPRGGTSAVAGLLRIFGIPLGGPDGWDGERKVVARLNEDENLRRTDVPTLLRRVRERDDGTPWMLKDPTLIDRWPNVRAKSTLSEDPIDWRVIYVFRDPWAVMDSERRNIEKEPDRGFADAVRRLRMLWQEARQDDDGLMLSFEQVRSAPGNVIVGLATWLREQGIHTNEPWRREHALRYLRGSYKCPICLEDHLEGDCPPSLPARTPVGASSSPQDPA